MENYVICPKCGAQNIAGVRFCSGCGVSFVYQQPVNQKRPKKNLKWWQTLFIVVFGIPIAFIVMILIITTIKLIINPSMRTSSEISSSVIQETREDYISSCQTINYSDLVRNPNNYIGQRIVVTGKISQYLTGGSFTENAFVLFEDYEYGKQDTYLNHSWYVLYAQPEKDRMIIGDFVTFYGDFEKIMKTNTIFGASMEVPRLIGKYHVIKKAKE